MSTINNPEINYTQSQKYLIFSAKEMVKKSLELKKFTEVRIIGSAGTGKTTIMKALVDEIRKMNYPNITIAAPTHKALSVIKSKVPYDYPQKVYFKTLASFLAMTSKLNVETDKTEFVFTEKTSYAFQRTQVLIIDEASMVPQEQYHKLVSLARKSNAVLIFVGDSKQLPPVSEEFSIATEPVHNAECSTYKLTEIVRQGKDNPIITISNDLSLVTSFRNNLTEDNLGYFYTRDKNLVIENLAKGRGSDKIKYLAWRNAVIDKINREVREYIYGENPEVFYEGETIIINGGNLKVKNNEELEIQKIEHKKRKFSLMKRELYELCKEDKGIKRLNIHKNTSESGLYFMDDILVFQAHFHSLNSGHALILKPHSEKYYNQAVKVLKALYKKNLISWPSVEEFQKTFVKFKYGYALSCHKSQGSTFKTVIVDLRDIALNTKEYDRLLYTSITRASDRVVFYYKYPEKQDEEN